jgi:membrane protease YdiL (CAAX protease family)
MSHSPFNPERFFKSACLFESALILVAIVLGWCAGINPFASLHFSEIAIFYGILGTLPLFLLFLALQQMTADSVVSIRRLLLETLAPGLARCNWADLLVLAAIAGISEEVLFRGVLQPWLEKGLGMEAGLITSNIIFGLVRCNWADLLVLAAIAGVSEEVLFRGVLQPWLEKGWGMEAGLITSNIIFGLVHAITPLYTVLATLVGIYLGLALDYGGERNLLTPIIIHGLYDFLAFVAIMKSYKENLVSQNFERES